MADGIDPELFVEDGGPVSFFIHSSVTPGAKDKIEAQIRAGGGELLDDDEYPDVIIVDVTTPAGKGVRTVREHSRLPDHLRSWVEHTSWVRHCVQNKRYAHKPPKVASIPGRRPGAGRVEYTPEDDENLCQFLARYAPDGGWKGTTVYAHMHQFAHQLPNQYGWALSHPQQSWRERYRKNPTRLEGFNSRITEIAAAISEEDRSKDLQVFEFVMSRMVHEDDYDSEAEVEQGNTPPQEGDEVDQPAEPAPRRRSQPEEAPDEALSETDHNQEIDIGSQRQGSASMEDQQEPDIQNGRAMDDDEQVDHSGADAQNVSVHSNFVPDARSPSWDSIILPASSPSQQERPLDTQRTLVPLPQAPSSKSIPRKAAKRRKQHSNRSSSVKISNTRSPVASISNSPASPERVTARHSSKSSPQTSSKSKAKTTTPGPSSSLFGSDSSSAEEWDSERELPNGPEAEDDTFDEGEVEEELQAVEDISTGSRRNSLPKSAIESASSRKRRARELSDDDEQTDKSLSRRSPPSLAQWNASQMEQSLGPSHFGTPITMPRSGHARKSMQSARSEGKVRMGSVLSVEGYPLEGTQAWKMYSQQKEAEYVPPPNTKAEKIYRRSKEFRVSTN